MRTQDSVSTKIPQRRAVVAAPAPTGVPAPPVRRAAPALAATPRFRLPTAADPAPPTGRVGAMCAWAAGLGLVGVFLAVRAFVAFFDEVPAWYQPGVVGVGVVGMGLTIGSFLAIHEKTLPWLLLTGATAALGANLVLVFAAP